ncbi:hypothetical protein F383_34381 [Gossypium arboreum]|uniref:Uncharacterized protein n=1 Tax=Gossypium arboreum TaxID=29729 RepID=A0A0B0N5P7_GOSAR|nr:hypothetical protein F383_34381 [Gossypium arboreum]
MRHWMSIYYFGFIQRGTRCQTGVLVGFVYPSESE